MIIGVPKEVKNLEFRVGIVPAGVQALVDAGHKVFIETNAGAGSSMPDSEYKKAGAQILQKAADVWKKADMVVKVKEPYGDEPSYFRPNLTLFTYLHLAPIPDLTNELLSKKVTGIAYETVTDKNGGLPLLAPMSEVAGRMSVQVGAHCLEKEQGGKGILLGGVPGVAAAKVVILGGGVSGTNAARVAMGMEAYVTVLDRSLPRLYELDLQFGSQLHTLFSTVETIEQEVAAADLVIGAVLVPGAAAPKLISRELVRQMKPGSVIVDMAASALGGNCELSKARETVVTENLVTILAPDNLPATMPIGSSAFYARNLSALLLQLVKDGALNLDPADEIAGPVTITHGGEIRSEAVKKLLNPAPAPAAATPAGGAS